MRQEEFTALLAAESFNEPATVEREANGSLDFHAHPFEIRALVLRGELRVQTADGEFTYRAGDVFRLAANAPHSESYGSSGVSLLVGRKTPTGS